MFVKKYLVALLAAAAAVPAAAVPFAFTQTMTNAYTLPGYVATSPVTVSGTFDGEANGNLITNISNVTLSIGGHAVNSQIYTARYDASTYTWHNDGVTLSFDGTANNALFIDVDFPTNPNYTNYFFSISAVNQDNAFSPFFAANYVYPGGASPLQITAMDADVPEPAMLGLFGLGALGLGLGRRRRA
jgi:hypothetical protein